VLGGALGGTSQYVLWSLAVVLEWLTPVIRGIGASEIAPAHFVERHGLVVIVAIGESVIAIGVGASHLPVDGALAAVAALGLALSACLWWLYFGGDDERAEHALSEMLTVRRARGALVAFGYAHLPMLFGIVSIAAAERRAFAHPFTALSWARATLLGGGVAIFLAGDVLLRREFGIGRVRIRAAAAALAAATLPLGAVVFPTAQIAALAALLGAAMLAERRLT
jgi:low temperature requirement protein LtrA